MSAAIRLEPGAIRVEVLLKDPVCWPVGRPDEAQLIAGPGCTEWAPVTVQDPEVCEHGETVCAECLESWCIDHYVRVSSPLIPDALLGVNNVPGMENL